MMEFIEITLLLVACFLSFVPLIKMSSVKDDTKYLCLKYFVNVAFFWTVLILLERLISNMTIVYYIHILGYPMKYVLASLMVCTVFHYVEVRMPKWLIRVFIIGSVAELVLALSNLSSQFLLQISLSSISSLDDLYFASKGSLFYFHLGIIYFNIIISVLFLILHLKKHKEIRHYQSVTKTIVCASIFVLGINFIQLFDHVNAIDWTFISLVISSFSLYEVIFNHDMIYNLKLTGRAEILANMREIYIITDEFDIVVDISVLLLEKYQLDKDTFIGSPISVLYESLKEHMVIYTSYDEIEAEFDQHDHYQLREKEFKLHGFRGSGKMILLYDETKVYHLLRELNQLSYYDYMTSLHNRNYIEIRLKSMETTLHTGVLSLDLNGLKVNNDYLGHDRGDYLLKRLAKIMKEALLPFDHPILARIGGDEFLILIENTTEETMIKLKERILSLCDHQELTQKISVSIGVSYALEEMNVYELIKRADEDMYNMKRLEGRVYAKAIVEYAKKTNQFIR